MKNLLLLAILLSSPAFANEDPLKLACQLKASSFAEQIESEPSLLDFKDKYNSNPLHAAAICGNLDTFEYIRTRRPEYLSTLNSWGDSPGHYLLLKRGRQYTEYLRELVDEVPDFAKHLATANYKQTYFSLTKNSSLEPIAQGTMFGAMSGAGAALIAMGLVRSAKLVLSGLRNFDRFVMSDLNGICLCTIVGSVAGAYLFQHNQITYDRIQKLRKQIYLNSFYD